MHHQHEKSKPARAHPNAPTPPSNHPSLSSGRGRAIKRLYASQRPWRAHGSLAAPTAFLSLSLPLSLCVSICTHGRLGVWSGCGLVPGLCPQHARADSTLDTHHAGPWLTPLAETPGLALFLSPLLSCSDRQGRAGEIVRVGEVGRLGRGGVRVRGFKSHTQFALKT